MDIGKVRPQDASDQPQGHTPNDTTPPTQDHERDQEDEHQDVDQVHDQEESIDQGGYEDDGDNEKNTTTFKSVPQCSKDRPVNNILGDIKKGVTIRSRVINFCEHYLFISSFDPFNVEDILHDPNWVVVM
jgi:hypothetical protein